MSSFDPKSLRERRRNKVRKPEELQKLSPGELGSLDVSRLVLSEIPATLALRVSFALMLRILQTRVDEEGLSSLHREALRQKIVELLLELGGSEELPAGDPNEALPAK
jgi:hypothetical protein